MFKDDVGIVVNCTTMTRSHPTLNDMGFPARIYNEILEQGTT